jgi:predicted aldo/keto reductase-like oxidoreductase
MNNFESNRRKFLKNSTLGIIGAGLLGKKSFAVQSQEQENELPKIKEYRILGRTGFKVSNLGFGRPSNPAILKAGVKAGINYFDTAPGYGPSEKDIGSIINEFDRKSLFITTKIHSRKLGSKDEILTSARKSLERLKVDYIDCFQLQTALSCEMVKHSGFHDAVAQLKQEGKVKFCGIACHGSYFPGNPEDTMENILKCAIDDGRYDLLLVVYNFLHHVQGNNVLKAARKKNIAAVVMKSNPVRKYNLMKDYAEQLEAENKEFPERYKSTYEEYKQYLEDANAYLENNGITSHDEQLSDVATRFVLNNQDVHCALIDFKNFNELESHIKYAEELMTPQSFNRVNDFRTIFSKIHCRIGCNICESKCPHHVPVNTIMRYNYYFTAKGQEKNTIQKYQELPGRKPDVCLNCEGFCEQACPYGVLTRPLLAMAHQNLSIGSGYYS